jgi:hypothetical protein
MPIFNLQTLMSQATAMVGQRLDLTPSQVSFWANTAQLEVATRAPHMFMLADSYFSTSASQSSASLPTDFLSPVALTNLGSGDSWGNHTMREVAQREIHNASEGTGNARPNRYAVSPPSLLLYPPADGAYSLRFTYYKTPTDLVNLSDTLSVGSVLRPAVIFKLAEYLFGVTLDVEREAFARNRYLSYLQSTPPDEAIKYRSERSTI